MIPQLREAHSQIYIDSYLFNLNVIPFKLSSSTLNKPGQLMEVISYLRGIARVNNLTFDVNGSNIYLRGGDFPKGALLELGFISEDTKNSIQQMGWDTFDIAGTSFVEVPEAHSLYLTEIAKIKREPFELQFNIIFYDQSLNKNSGIDLGTFVDTNLNMFDLVYQGELQAVIENLKTTSSPRFGISLFSNPKLIETTLNEVITTSLSGIIGSESKISIQDEIPFETRSLSSDGIRVTNSIEFVNAGFLIGVNSRRSSDGITFDFNIENSSVDFSQEVNGLPIVKRRLITSRKHLKPGETVEIARIESKITSDRSSRLPFLKRIKYNSKDDTQGTISVLCKRIN